jgi:hypothetical protein
LRLLSVKSVIWADHLRSARFFFYRRLNAISRRVTISIAALLLAATIITSLVPSRVANAVAPIIDICQLNGYSQIFSYVTPQQLTLAGYAPGDFIVLSSGSYEGHNYRIGFRIDTQFNTTYGGYAYYFAYEIDGCGGPTFHDGRINRYDAAQTVAIYCNIGEEGGIFTLIPAKPFWVPGLKVTAAEINKVPKHPAKNTLIKKKGLVSLYRLTSGELQLNAPGINHMKEDYNFIFNDCGF